MKHSAPITVDNFQLNILLIFLSYSQKLWFIEHEKKVSELWKLKPFPCDRISTVPPKISPFHSTMLSLNVGDRASITCSVQKGDTPLHIKWLKNGILVDPSQRISVTQVDQYNSILVIEQLSDSHSGNYSCFVSNQAGEVESSQALLVNGKLLIKKIDSQFSSILSCFCVFCKGSITRARKVWHLIHTKALLIFDILFVERDSLGWGSKKN